MIPGRAIVRNLEGDYVRETYCEIVRILHDFDKVLVRFPNNPRVYVKSLRNVVLDVRHQFSGGKKTGG